MNENYVSLWGWWWGGGGGGTCPVCVLSSSITSSSVTRGGTVLMIRSLPANSLVLLWSATRAS